MSGGSFSDQSGNFENGNSTSFVPSDETFSSRSSALSSKLTSVLSRSYGDPEIRDTLSILDARGHVDGTYTRWKLKLDAQKEVTECNGAIVQDFGLVAEQLTRIGTMITDLKQTCAEMRHQIHIAQRESGPMLDEAAGLTVQKKDIKTKQQLLDAFRNHFIVPDEDLDWLTSSTNTADERFFQVLDRVKQIRKDCEVLLGTENQQLGMEIMEQTSRSLDAAFSRLYNWIQRELQVLDLEDPHIAPSTRRALRVLAERPTMFRTCLDHFSQTRERTLADAFHLALTETVSGGPNVAQPANPIDHQTHDLLRYVGDMLAWVHSTTVSEREALQSLFISNGNEIATKIQAGGDEEPWAEGDLDLDDLVNRDLEGVTGVLKKRVEIAIRSNEDPFLVYKALNLLKLYQEIFGKLVGTSSLLRDTLAELYSSAFAHFDRLLQDEISAAPHETAAESFSPPQFLTDALDRFESFIRMNPDLPGIEISRLLSAALVPFLDQCSEMSGTITDGIAQDIFQLNYLAAVDSALKPLLPHDHGFLKAARSKVDELRRDLAESQYSFLLHESGVESLLAAIEAATADNPDGADFASLAVFQEDALSASAAQLDEFLPSALMDLLENMKRITQKSLAQDIAHEAAERFCIGFERVEEAVLRASEELDRRRIDMEGEEVLKQEWEPLPRELYPRTTAEIRVLLS